MQQHQQRALAGGLEADLVTVEGDLFVRSERFARLAPRHRLVNRSLGHLICMPEMARLITSRWISEVPSKIVQILASRCIRSTGNSRL